MFYDAPLRKREMAEVFPRRFGKYVLLKSLARGGMGEIYVAATGEPGFQKFCVIKKVIAERTDQAKANRFLDEAKVVLRLAHANLVPTFDAGEHDGEFYIAMELVEGKDLREIWNRCVRTRTRIPLDVALHVARETARALSYVHSYGDLKLVHRDVAPPNILLSYFGEVKLTDFGLARSVLKQEHTAPGVVFGRAAYLAPEQARGEVADARSDIYSLGVVVWELLTGHQYLQLQNLDAATAMSLVRHPHTQPPSAKAAWVTPELDAVIMRALAPAREERYQSAEEMRQSLAHVIARLSPRADAERSAEFLRTLCGEAMREEQAERERLLGESIGLNASEDFSDMLTPVRGHKAEGPSARPAEHAVVTEAAPRGRTTPPRADFTGRIIESRYKILRVLGEGGMGTVYAAEHVEIGKGVAVKILHPQYSRQQDLVERFRREARAASRIGHPHIIDVTDFGTTEDGCAYFVMEHLDGLDLADVRSHERRLDPARAAQITIQICRALEAAHAAGVIHRDLKPENIFLVARDGRADFVKVLDFGIARSGQDSSRLTNPGIAMGTPEYMAPEQALGGLADRRSDIYSVGALLYEMVTGIPPHGEAEEVSALKKQEPPRPPRELRPELPEELELVILRALEADPAKRHQRMAALEYDLTKTQLGRPRAVSDLLGLRGPEARAGERGGPRARLAAAARPRRERPATPAPAARTRSVPPGGAVRLARARASPQRRARRAAAARVGWARAALLGAARPARRDGGRGGGRLSPDAVGPRGPPRGRARGAPHRRPHRARRHAHGAARRLVDAAAGGHADLRHAPRDRGSAGAAAAGGRDGDRGGLRGAGGPRAREGRGARARRRRHRHGRRALQDRARRRSGRAGDEPARRDAAPAGRGRAARRSRHGGRALGADRRGARRGRSRRPRAAGRGAARVARGRGGSRRVRQGAREPAHRRRLQARPRPRAQTQRAARGATPARQAGGRGARGHRRRGG